MRVCPTCAAENEDAAAFCDACGDFLDWSGAGDPLVSDRPAAPATGLPCSRRRTRGAPALTPPGRARRHGNASRRHQPHPRRHPDSAVASGPPTPGAPPVLAPPAHPSTTAAPPRAARCAVARSARSRPCAGRHRDPWRATHGASDAWCAGAPHRTDRDGTRSGPGPGGRRSPGGAVAAPRRPQLGADDRTGRRGPAGGGARAAGRSRRPTGAGGRGRHRPTVAARLGAFVAARVVTGSATAASGRAHGGVRRPGPAGSVERLVHVDHPGRRALRSHGPVDAPARAPRGHPAHRRDDRRRRRVQEGQVDARQRARQRRDLPRRPGVRLRRPGRRVPRRRVRGDDHVRQRAHRVRRARRRAARRRRQRGGQRGQPPRVAARRGHAAAAPAGGRPAPRRHARRRRPRLGDRRPQPGQPRRRRRCRVRDRLHAGADRARSWRSPSPPSGGARRWSAS